MEFLRNEHIGGLALIVGIIGLAASGLQFTPLVLGLLAFGGLWTTVVVFDAIWTRARRSKPHVVFAETGLVRCRKVVLDPVTGRITALHGLHIEGVCVLLDESELGRLLRRVLRRVLGR